MNAGALNGFQSPNIAQAISGLTGQTSLSATFTSPIASQDTIVCAASSLDTSSSYVIPTDTSGNTYLLASPASSAPSRGTGISQAIYYSQGVLAAGTNTVTMTWGSGGASNPVLICSDVVGLIGGLDVQAVTSGNNLAPTNSVTATPTSDVMFSAVTAATANNPQPVSPALQVSKEGNTLLQYTDLFASGVTADNAVLNVGSQWLMNTVLLKSVALGTATATVTTSNPGSNSIGNQQLTSTQFYAGSIFTTALPADANTHCWNTAVPAGGSPETCSSSSADQAVVQNVFGGSNSPGGFSLSNSNYSTASSGGGGNGFYYSTASNPIYLITSGSNPCPPLPLNCAAGKYFHLPPGAEWDSCAGDENIKIWDQSTDIDSTPGGRILTSYFFNSGACSVRSIPTTCTATTKAQAAATPACQIALYYNALNYPFNDSYALDDSTDSASYAGAAGYPRELEIENNVMGHALLLGVGCVASTNGVANAPVFPAYGNVLGCSGTTTLAPLNGSLFWIDSGYSCSTLPLWQQPFCTAMQTYGGYIHDTGQSLGVGVFVYPIEGGIAHTVANLNDLMFNEPNTGATTAWIITNGVTGCPAGGYPKVCTGANGLEVIQDSATSAEKIVWTIFNMPGLITGHHLHILDPCVAKFMAGQPGGCQ